MSVVTPFFPAFLSSSELGIDPCLNAQIKKIRKIPSRIIPDIRLRVPLKLRRLKVIFSPVKKIISALSTSRSEKYLAARADAQERAKY